MVLFVFNKVAFVIRVFGIWKGMEGQALAALQEGCSGKGVIRPFLKLRTVWTYGKLNYLRASPAQQHFALVGLIMSTL